MNIQKVFLLFILSTTYAVADEISASLTIDGQSASISASSQLSGPANEPLRYSLHKLFDKDAKTAWVEGVDGITGEHYLNIKFKQPVSIRAIALLPGFTKSASLFAANAVPEQVSLTLGDESNQSKFRYITQSLVEKDQGEGCTHTDQTSNLQYKLFLPTTPKIVDQVKLVFSSALAGTKYEDMAISELIFIGDSFATTKQFTPLVNSLLAIKDSSLMQQKIPSYQITYDQNTGWGLTQTSLSQDQTSYMIEDYLTNATLFQNHFLNTWLDIDASNDSTTIIGSMVTSMGDGEWIEVSPALKVKDNTANFAWRYHIDGAPGCHHAMPTNSVEIN
ncbi:hypothetical protein Q4519_21310 [Motilimonas sp. 1_MG-2023]|uniref:NADase-type glycan-binding domain-containing protein n=1 Tax=Motilimonas sp. 1_MG-2023 TaxID=3062672 RepID=UPI0026E27986|nr:hypothetical protein [Motilimonas sp. 1_MG-2023]MDO6528207.1 hypothetical protein [Motilimonas sp. 1_MG-2023]